MKFFVPSAFDKSTEEIKFKATSRAAADPVSKAKKNRKNKNKKLRNAAAAAATCFKGKGPLAPPRMDEDDASKDGMNKVNNNGGQAKDSKPQTSRRNFKLAPSSLDMAQKMRKELNANADESMSVEPSCDTESEFKVVKHGKVRKNRKKQNELKPTTALLEAAKSSINNGEADSSLVVSSLQAKLQEQLMGGRFRFLNEQLYTMNGHKAQELFKKDPESFKAYHDGYRHQVKKWPLNPLDRIIKMVKKLPKSLEIGDFGCGEGKLATSVPHKVYSMDLVSSRKDIIACDMANTPLQTHSLDVAVYCLSLMGTNLKDYLLEANRVLKIDGFMYVAEIQSRFDNVKEFTKNVCSFGFQFIRQDVGQKVFYFFVFKKVQNVGKVANVPQLSLKPCLYRKR